MDAAERQYRIEREAGIDERVAAHMTAGKTVAARTAMDALRLCIARYENGAMGILQGAVFECHREINK